MDLSNIKERLYNSFGAGSSEMLLILIEFVNAVQPNLHKIA